MDTRRRHGVLLHHETGSPSRRERGGGETLSDKNMCRLLARSPEQERTEMTRERDERERDGDLERERESPEER